MSDLEGRAAAAPGRAGHAGQEPGNERSNVGEPTKGAGERAGSLYERLGGAGALEALVARFYEGVAVDPVLRPLYPEEDLQGARDRLTAFLVQLAGGPRRYEALRGEPRLRLRHLAFPIGQAEAAAWLARMEAALQATPLDEEVEAELRTYFTQTAGFLVNQGGLSLRGGRSARGRPGTGAPSGAGDAADGPAAGSDAGSRAGSAAEGGEGGAASR